MQAVVPAAGSGTRLRPLTDSKSQTLVSVAGDSLLTRCFDRRLEFAINEVVVVIARRLSHSNTNPNRYGNLGIPPRPTGIKRPNQRLPPRDRLGFNALSTMLTAARGVGYYQECASGDPHVDRAIPHRDDSK